MFQHTLLQAIVTALALLPSSTDAFVSPSAATATAKLGTRSALPAFPPEFLDGLLAPDPTISPEVGYARKEFWFYFFAGSGAGGIGIAQLPSIFREAGAARDVAGTGPTLGGPALDAGPLVGLYYDSEISEGDVADAIQKAPTAEFISSRSESVNYMASKGYIEQGDFLKEMNAKKCNPLASIVLFNAISAGKGGLVSPVVYEDKLAAYREVSSTRDVASSFVGDLNGFLAVKAAAFVGLVFCLLVDLGFVASAGIPAWL
mmetsp:Transcript_34725/g.83923  ORF Transcript_34725/g.83923 Transcript_34725/m.83923 type:complete len:260 (-) Transcript_34725:570-1349(-)|eukprot:CAMPEP_0181105592 /NCGR_PEP_ID=MMETSP1071-20121207/16072_1 /TAXON_ID=35127 /ORGANISM="Thalassiosira sp., Strain NH16" /LENGTH=259 /DNA_ID=CAMNT_0023188925 /DNA_START=102 /DNA_END=881 /DNA_ORIENTATION=+